MDMGKTIHYDRIFDLHFTIILQFNKGDKIILLNVALNVSCT